MYLSCLQIDTGEATGRRWLANPYRVHQRLAMAFPAGGERVLFRIEDGREPPRIIVQAPGPADWAAAFARHRVLLAPPLQKEVKPQLQPGQRLRFLLRANPTKRLSVPAEDGEPPDRPGRRLGLLRESEQREWL
ncbi:MAG: type I-E CRISPR-associated protein Cas6/Cse3/CasE, partial [Chloroflexota bacterium]